MPLTSIPAKQEAVDCDPLEALIVEEEKVEARQRLKRLTTDETNFLLECFEPKHGYKAIAESLGISRQAVYKRKDKLLNILKRV